MRPCTEHPCPRCGDEIALDGNDFDGLPWNGTGYAYTHECGAALLLDAEGGYGDDGSQWAWWVVACDALGVPHA